MDTVMYESIGQSGNIRGPWMIVNDTCRLLSISHCLRRASGCENQPLLSLLFVFLCESFFHSVEALTLNS